MRDRQIFDREHRSRADSHYSLDSPRVDFSNPIDDEGLDDGEDDDGELAFTRDLKESWWSGIPTQDHTCRYRRDALIGEHGEGKVWMAGGFFTLDSGLFIAYGDDKQVTAFDMASDQTKVLVKRADGIHAAILSPDSLQLCVADEGGALIMYDLKKLLQNFDGDYDAKLVGTKQEDGGATIWSEHVPTGFEHGRGHQRRHHNCTCDACGKKHSSLAAALPGLAKVYKVADYDEHNEPDTPYHAQAEHMCGCDACDETLQKIEGRLEVIKNAHNAKMGTSEDDFLESFETSLRNGGSDFQVRENTDDVIVQLDSALPWDDTGSSEPTRLADTRTTAAASTLTRTGKTRRPQQFALGDHGCGCSACAETLAKLESDVTMLKGSLGGTPLDSAVCYMSYSNDGRLLFVVNKEKLKAGIRDSADGKLLHVIDFPMMDSSNGWNITPTCALSVSSQTYLGSPGLLALAGGGEKSEEIAIYTVPGDPAGERFTEEEIKSMMKQSKSIQLRDGMNASNVALSPIGHQAAIGATDGTVWLVSTDPHDDPVDHGVKSPTRKALDREISPPTGACVSCLVYSHDGAKVAVTWENGRCVVFDAKTTAPLAQFMHASLYGGLVLAFSPKDDLIAVGGGMSGKCVFHALRPNVLERYRVSSSKHNDTEARNIYPTLTAAVVNKSHVVLVHGRHIEVQRRRTTDLPVHRSATVSQHKVLDDIEADNMPIAMNSQEVAYVRQRTQKIEVKKLGETGTNDSYEFEVPGAIRGVRYSPDGKLLLVFGGWGVTVLSDGEKWKEKLVASYINNAVVDTGNQWLATTGDAGTGFIYDLKTEWGSDASAGEVFDLESRETVQGLAFDDEGRRLAYFVMGTNEVIVRLAPTPPATETDDEKWKQYWPPIARFPVRDWAWAQLAFSPGSGQWLMCTNLPETDRPATQGSIAIIDSDTGLEPDWSYLLRPLGLPLGEIQPHNVGWTQAPSQQTWLKLQSRLWSRRSLVSVAAQTVHTENVDQFEEYGETSYHLCVYVAVGNEIAVINLTQFVRSCMSDGNFSMLQMCHLTEKKPWLIEQLSSRLPHLVNVQERHTGETILHYCARKEMSEEMGKWLSPRDVSACYTPIEGKYVPGDDLFTTEDESTALHLAIKMHSGYSVKVLISNMTRELNELTGSLATSAIKFMAEKMPKMVRPCMQILYGEEIHGWPTKEHVASPIVMRKLRTERASTQKEFVLVGANHFVYGTIKDLWGGKLTIKKSRKKHERFRKKHETVRLIDQKCVLLAGLAGDPDTSPLRSIVKNCDSSVFGSELLRLVVEFKWERNVFPMLKRAMALYAVRVILATTSMLISTYSGRSTGTDLLVVLVIAVEGLSLANECLQLVKKGWREYFTSIWNYADVIGPCALVAAAVSRLHMPPQQICDGGNLPGCEVLHTWGALGVMLKAFSTLDFLRSFRSTGPLVRMLVVITNDVLPFLSILTIVTLGSTLFLMINIPNSPGFDIDYKDPDTGESKVVGKALPIMTMLHVITNNFEVEHYSTTASIIVLIVFLLVGVIVMLNLLIAIMGDSYDRQQAKEKVEGLMQMARIIIEYEETLPAGSFFHGKDVHYPLYLHMAEEAQSADDLGSVDDLGISGRISRQLGVTQLGIEDHVRRIHTKTQSEIQILRAEIGKIYTMMDTGEVRESLNTLLGKGSEVAEKKKRFWKSR